MAYDFPASPSVGTLFAPAGGPTWQWNGTSWLSVAPSGLVPEAPVDGQNYVRRNGVWVVAPGTAEAKNRIVNGAMQISQENGTTPVSTNAAYVMDQWQLQMAGITGQASKTTATTHQLGTIVSTGKPSLAVGDYLGIYQLIEGNRVWDFGWGGANALPAVLRFEAYVSSTPGTYGAAVRSVPATRSIVFPFTVPAAGAWTPFAIPVLGDTGGTWPVDNTASISVSFNFAAGTTYTTAPGVWTAGNFIGPNGMTNGAATTNSILYIRNVGLHLDPQNTGIAPPWQMPDEAQELAACQRYWERMMTGFSGNATSGSNYYGPAQFTVPKRTTAALSGIVASGVIGFPNTVGTLNVLGLGLAPPGLGVQEVRVCNVTGPSVYNSLVTANARM